ncbi:DUF3267 domain-containing protein [Lysinibacillus sp. 3P01SB]|uniref:DUF3267 domain-containing protein n=1 Tax=Lysinibacillus sp. 3P01SB TaxID=3132284 RepID=UPI0039A63FA1
MNCIKTINIEYEYGTPRVFLLTGLTFILTFCFSYILIGLTHTNAHSDARFFQFAFTFFLLYPVHKLIHYLSLLNYRKSLSYRIKIKFSFIPILHMRLQDPIPKRRYIFSLLAPFCTLNPLFVAGALVWPVFSHYFCLLFALHCSICLLDLLYVKDLWKAPKNAIIEETPRGYEILIPSCSEDSSNLSP